MLPKFHEMSQPGLVSIIVPCYNAERFLAETLESAFVQSYPRTEIIVVDDGSTDRTAHLIQSYGERVRGDFGPNRGASAARNRGTALARGEFIQYLDADDMLLPDAIERRVNALQAAQADVAYSDWERLVERREGVFEIDERVVRRMEDVDPSPTIAALNFWAPPAALTYRRTIVEKVGGWKEWLPIIQDARFLQDASLIGGRFVYAPGVGARYRVHGGASLSRQSEGAFVSDVFRNACDLQATFASKGGITSEERRALAQIYDYVARSLFYYDRGAFRDCIARLYEVEPGFSLRWPKFASLSARMLGFRLGGALLSSLIRLRSLFRPAS
jgi:glycosyltransferase involved in cell wall biosynthesis